MILSKYFVAKGGEWDLLAIPGLERKSEGIVPDVIVVIFVNIMMLCQVRVSQVLQGLDTPSAN